MKTTNNWKELKKKLLENPAVKQAYDKLEPAYQLANSLIRARLDKKMTQQELAKQAGVTLNTIYRLESGTEDSKIETVSRVAKVLNKELRLVDITS